MECWTCKYYSYTDYEVDSEGNEQPYGNCSNEKSEEHNEDVPECYGCDKHEGK